MRMHWSHGFSLFEESFVNNYIKMIDSAERYGVEGIIIWGFLRDMHGGVDAAKKIVDHALSKNVKILPGVGIDCYGGIYYEGSSKYNLETYLKENPQSMALDENGEPLRYRHNADVDPTWKYMACPSDEKMIDYYREGLNWLVETFSLQGFQIEQGDKGLCHCEKCKSKKRTTTGFIDGLASLSDASVRIPETIKPVLEKHPDITIICETYSKLTSDSVDRLGAHLDKYPPQVTLAWHVYYGPVDGHKGECKIEERVKLPREHGIANILTNNFVFRGETNDSEGIANALEKARNAGFDMTYIYGEYPDHWPDTRKIYETWSEHAS